MQIDNLRPIKTYTHKHIHAHVDVQRQLYTCTLSCHFKRHNSDILLLAIRENCDRTALATNQYGLSTYRLIPVSLHQMAPLLPAVQMTNGPSDRQGTSVL